MKATTQTILRLKAINERATILHGLTMQQQIDPDIGWDLRNQVLALADMFADLSNLLLEDNA